MGSADNSNGLYRLHFQDEKHVKKLLHVPLSWPGPLSRIARELLE